MTYKHSFKGPFYFLPAIMLFILVVPSCTKDDSRVGETYEMSFSVNGTTVKYTSQASLLANFANTGAQYLAVFTGNDATSSMNITAYDDQPVSKKSYSGYATSGTALVGVLMTYQDNDGTVFSQGGGDVIVSISSITDTSVSGTFSGILKASGKPDMVITDGKFTLKRTG
ncbi:hypothetical protein ACE1ET_14735 [Saccharicrinis sp. FJH62]|uniref:hypothetical protein n=1 Tax=Saccharicrinis sp. FJH62 TaxID=3344657 RepID=UPI0035D52023